MEQLQTISKGDTGMDIATSRQIAEAQGAVLIAKKFPRDESASRDRIMVSCQRIRLAEAAEYTYPKGNKIIKGPSIRLAEAIAQEWGNMSFGVIELYQGVGESKIMSYAWDIQSNTKREMVFTVRHEIMANKKIKKLTDPREIYELCANYGARRQRACLMAVIPGDIFDMAIDECEKTLIKANDKPLKTRIVKMLSAFAKYSVTKEMIEAKLGHNIDATTEQEFVELNSIRNSLKDDIGGVDDYFKPNAVKEGGLVDSVSDDTKEEKTPEEKPEPKKEKAPTEEKPADEPRDEQKRLYKLCEKDKIAYAKVAAWASEKGRNIDITKEEGCKKIIQAWETVKEALGEK